MKNLNIKNLLVKGVIPLATVLTMSSYMSLPVKAEQATSATTTQTTQQENNDIETKAFTRFKSLFYKDLSEKDVVEEGLDETTSNSLFSWLDKHFLSFTPCKTVAESNSTLYVPQGYITNGYLSFDSFRLYNDGEIRFYNNKNGIFIDNDGWSEWQDSSSNEHQKLACIFNNGHIYYQYFCTGKNDRWENHKDLKTIIVTYSPYDGTLTIDSSIVDNAWLFADSTKTSCKQYTIPEDKRINMIDQMATLLKKQVTPTGIENNITDIVNARYGFHYTEETQKETQKEEKKTEQESENKVGHLKVFDNLISSIQGTKSVDSQKIEEYIKELDFKDDDELKQTVIRLLNAIESNEDYKIEIDKSNTYKTTIRAKDDIGNSIRIISSSTEKQIWLSSFNNYSFAYTQNDKYPINGSCYSFLGDLTDKDRNFYSMLFYPDTQQVHLSFYDTDRKLQACDIYIPKELTDSFLYQMYSDFQNQESEDTIINDIIQISNGNEPKNNVTYTK